MKIETNKDFDCYDVAEMNGINRGITIDGKTLDELLADERRKFIAFMIEHTHCRTDCENILNCDGKKCWNKYLDMYEKEHENGTE